MSDLLGLIVLILIGVAAQKNKKQKKKQRAVQSAAGEPIIPYDLSAQKDVQLAQEMRAIRAKAREKLDAQRAAQASEPSVLRETVMQTVMLPPRPEAVDPDVPHVHQPAVQPDAVEGESLEGADPCHDELYNRPQAETQDACETDALDDNDGAAQELLRGMILSEVLARPVNRWRTQHR